VCAPLSFSALARAKITLEISKARERKKRYKIFPVYGFMLHYLMEQWRKNESPLAISSNNAAALQFKYWTSS